MSTSETPFSSKLSDGNTLTGWQLFPDRTSISGPGTPLLVGTMVEVMIRPIIMQVQKLQSFSLPKLGSSSLPELKNGETFIQQCGKYLHDVILPHIWNEITRTQPSHKPTSIVLLAHSIDAAIAIVAAGLYAEDSKYPLAGIVLSGIGVEFDSTARADMAHIIDAPIQPPTVTFIKDGKDELMLGLEDSFDPSIKEETERLNNTMTFPDIFDIRRSWIGYWKAYVSNIEVPMFYMIAQHDALFVGTPQNAEDFGK